MVQAANVGDTTSTGTTTTAAAATTTAAAAATATTILYATSRATLWPTEAHKATSPW